MQKKNNASLMFLSEDPWMSE